MADITSSFEFNVASGNVRNMRTESKFGRNTDIDTAAIETIWDGGGVYSFPASASVLTVTSTDVEDDTDVGGGTPGTGAFTVEIFGLDANYLEIKETVTLNGTADVLTDALFLRVFRMIVRTSGTTGWNEGVITAKIGATTHAQIAIGNNQTLMAIWTVPANCTAFISNLESSLNAVAAGGTAVLTFKARPLGEVFQIKRITGFSETTSPALRNFNYLLSFPEKTDLKVEATVDNNNTDISASWDMIVKYKSAALKESAQFD